MKGFVFFRIRCFIVFGIRFRFLGCFSGFLFFTLFFYLEYSIGFFFVYF